MRILIKKIETIAFILTGSIVLLISAFLILSSNYQPKAWASTCSTNMTLVVYSGNNGSSTSLSKISDININMPTSSTPQVKEVIIYAANETTTRKPIGRALPGPSYVWNFKWDTSLWPNGPVALSADVYYIDKTEPCNLTSDYSNVYIMNEQPSLLNIQPMPTSWKGEVNSNQVFTVKSSLNTSTFDPTPYSIYKWSKVNDIGSVSPILPNGERANFSSGIIAGENTIKVQVFYGGANRAIAIPVTVEATSPTPTNDATQTNTTNNTNTDQSNDSSTTTTQQQSSGTNQTPQTSTESTTQVTSSKVEINQITKSCIEKLIPADRYAIINQGTSRPTYQEISKIRSCFATSNHILPSNFSPLDPATTKDLPVTNVASVKNLENIKKQDNLNEKEVLKISGNAEPNSVVVIYIYSDPLVITTSTDSNGNWEYTLEDPLEPGTHEVYAVVNKGDGTYERSDPLSFIISTASASEVNPNGLSLTLAAQPTATATQSNNSLVLYIASSIAVLVAIPAAIYMFIRMRIKHDSKHLITSTDQAVNNTQPVISVPTDNNLSSETQTDTPKEATEKQAIQNDNTSNNNQDKDSSSY